MALVGLQAPQGSDWPVTGMTGLLMQASSFKTEDSSDGRLWRQACLSVNLAKKFVELGCSLTLLTKWRLLRRPPSHHPSSLHCLQLFPLPPPHQHFPYEYLACLIRSCYLLLEGPELTEEPMAMKPVARFQII